jgi:uncharacterized protein with NRDE domain
MCTVSFIYKGDNDFVLTSNRDEAIGRKTIAPKLYEEANTVMVYPKDTVAGGTWIGASGQNRLLCLLNGAFVKHKRKTPYEKSRGILVKDLLCVANIEQEIRDYVFDKIEPFTLLIIDWNSNLKLIELIWDGVNVLITHLPLKPRIWSSSTLYNQEMKSLREKWFSEYLVQNGSLKEDLFYFHEHYGVGDSMLDMKIDRGLLKTVSITQFDKEQDDLHVVYKDLLKSELSRTKFNI